MSAVQAGWYDDGTGGRRWWDGERWTDEVQQPQADLGRPVPPQPAPPRAAQERASYVVLQVILKEKLWGTGSGNLTELENAINAQAALGYRLHTISTASSGSKGMGGGDRIQATMVFERIA